MFLKPQRICFHNKYKKILSSNSSSYFSKRKLTNFDVQKKRTILFDKEEKRQNSLITDVEKIKINYIGHPEEVTLIMNKDLSTPSNCAQHISSRLETEAVVAEVNGDVYDMFRPLHEDCTLRFLHFREADPFYVNRIFWRSLSFMLGAVLESSFKDDVFVQLCSFPPPKVRSGSFVYDANIPLDSWEPSMAELRNLFGQMIRLAMENKPFRRLEIDASLALKMFEDNRYKKEQIPSIASSSKSGKTVTLYRVGDFIDISKGPMMSRSGHMGKCTIAAAIPIILDDHKLFRFQGVSLPSGFRMNHYTYGIIEDRARKPNSLNLPLAFDFISDEELPPEPVTIERTT